MRPHQQRPKTSVRMFAGVVAICVLLPACASQRSRTQRLSPTVPSTPSVSEELPPPLYGDAQPERRFEQAPATSIEEELDQAYDPSRTYNLTVRDTDVRAVLLAIAQEADLSIVIEPNAVGTVTNDIRGVTLPVLLHSLLEPLQLEYRVEEGVLRIRDISMETRFFFVDIVVTDRTGTRTLGASTGHHRAGNFPGINASGIQQGVLGSPGGSADVSSSDGGFLWEEITQGIAFLMSAGGGALSANADDSATAATGSDTHLDDRKTTPSMHVNRSAGTVMVRHFPRVLDEIQEYLDSVEEIMQRQVLIEAQIVEVTLREEFQAGVDWSAVLRDLGVTSTQKGGVNGGNIFKLSLLRDDISAVFGALQNQGEVNVLSSPSVVTLNNQVALLSVGSQEVFFTTTTMIDPVNGRIIATMQQPGSVVNGVILSVTPQIAADGWVTMSIQPAISERTGEAVSGTGETFPIMDVRVTDNVIRVQEGDTIFIGGLLADVLRQTESKTPILGDIPLLGNLFKRKIVSKQKSDLIIMITPTVLGSERIRALMRDQVQRIETRRGANRAIQRRD